MSPSLSAFSLSSHFSRFPSHGSQPAFSLFWKIRAQRGERQRVGEGGGGEGSGEEGSRGLLLNGNGPNEQSPLHSAILRLICASPPSFAPSLVPFSADNTFGKRTRRRGRGGGRETRTQRRRRTLNKLCAIAAAGTGAAEGKHADDICRKYAASPS